MELGCNSELDELHPNGVGPQANDDGVRVQDENDADLPNQISLTPTSENPIKQGESVGVSVGVKADWLDDLVVRVKEIPPKAWIDVTETHGRLYARWKSKIPAPTSGKKSLYLAPLDPIKTENKLDDDERKVLEAKRKRGVRKHNRNAAK